MSLVGRLAAARPAPRVEKPEKDLSLPRARASASTALRGDRTGRAPYLVEWHKRFAFPVAAVVFALVAFPLAVRSHRGGRSIALVGSLVILVAYYLVLTSLESVGAAARLPPALAIWTPNLLFSALGASLLVATAREWRCPRAARSLWRALAAAGARAARGGATPTAARRRAGARDSTHILDRYLLREYLVFMGIGLAVAAALFVVIDLLQTLDRYLRMKPPLIYVLEHFVYRVPAALHDGLPVVMLVATIFLFLALSRYHELTAMKAAGMSLYRVSAPMLVLGPGVAVASRALPGAAAAAAQRAGRRGGPGEDPRPAPAPPAVARAPVAADRRQPLLPRGAAPPRHQRPVRRDRARGRPADFRLQSRLDARRAHWTPEGWELSDGAFREFGPEGEVQTIPFALTAIDLQEEIERLHEDPEADRGHELSRAAGLRRRGWRRPASR